MANEWNILVVDDEKDVHSMTSLALKRAKWRGRPFTLTSVYSAKEARDLLTSPDCPPFQVALVDVVMESSDAGLALCEWMRANLPRTLRIILRTGQAGMAPEEKVLNDYDIDHYLSKAEASPERLYILIRACLRSSEDIATLEIVTKQLFDLSVTLRAAGAFPDLMKVMKGSLEFIERKHDVKLAFMPDLRKDASEGYVSLSSVVAGTEQFVSRARTSINAAHDQKVEPNKLQAGEPFGLGAHQFIAITSLQQDPSTYAKKPTAWQKVTKWFGGRQDFIEYEPIRGGVFVEFSQKPVAVRVRDDFAHDLRIFMEHWNLAFSTFLVQQNIAQVRALDAEAFWNVSPSKAE